MIISSMGAETQTRASWAWEMQIGIESLSQLKWWAPYQACRFIKSPAASTTLYFWQITQKRAIDGSFGLAERTISDKLEIIRIKTNSAPCGSTQGYPRTRWVKTAVHTNSNRFQLGMQALPSLMKESCMCGVPEFSENSNALAKSNFKTTYAFRVSMSEARSLS